jgi:hypothetical protein
MRNQLREFDDGFVTSAVNYLAGSDTPYHAVLDTVYIIKLFVVHIGTMDFRFSGSDKLYFLIFSLLIASEGFILYAFHVYG